jgi:hypothetical protein
VLASLDAVEVLEAALAAMPAARPEPGPAHPDEGPFGLHVSRAVQAMILLNISAALFGSNQVRLRLIPLFKRGPFWECCKLIVEGPSINFNIFSVPPVMLADLMHGLKEAVLRHWVRLSSMSSL